MNRARVLVALMAIASLLAIVVTPAIGQEFRGTILGQINDAKGAAVPGARVLATNEATNTSVGARSNDEGNYTVPFLLPGRYTVTVEAPGFKRAMRSEIIVQVQDKITLNFSLEVGAISEMVNVIAETPLLQTANADLGQVVSRHFLDRLPVSGQSPLNLADMAPGVITGSGGVTSNAQNDIAINGGNGKNRGNDVTIDGIPNISARQRGLAVTIPMPDAVEEFKVQTTMFDASLALSNGGALAVTTRGGTNNLHGSAYYYTRNRALDANTWTNNRLGLAKPAIKNYVWGGVIGGPVRVPKYNGRDRTFFFFGFERTVNARPLTREARVPTEIERRGDFSQTLSRNGSGIVQIFDPFSTTVDSSGRFKSRSALAGSKIPENLLSPVGLAVLSQYPLPNQPGPTQIGRNNWGASSTFTTFTKNLQARIDQQLSSRQRLYVRFSLLRHIQSPTPNLFAGAFSFPVGGETDVATDRRRNHSLAANDTFTFSPTFVGSFSYGYTRTNIKVFAAGDGLDPALLKLPPVIISNQFDTAWPVFDLSADGMPSIGSRTRGSVNDRHSLLATFNKLQGSHSFRFGTNYQLLRWNEPNPGPAANGFFVFNNTLTRSNPTSSASGDTSGSAIASLLLGLPATVANSRLGFTSPLSLQSHYVGLFFQDDFKVSQKLTLNLGLRYELETPFTERFNRAPYGFDPTADLRITVAGVGSLKGGLLFVGEGGLSRYQGKTDKNNFGPRVGLAYSIDNKTVLRAGYGIFYSSGAVNLSNGAPGTVASFGSITPYVGSTNSDTTVLTGVSISNPFPNGLVPVTGNSLGLKTELGNRITFLNQNRLLPYAQQWQLSIQRELPWQTLFEAAYVGAHSLKLYEDFDLDELPDRFFNATDANISVPNPFLGVLPANTVLGRGTTIRQNKLRVLFPQFDQVNMQMVNTGRSLYHSLQTRMQKRLSNGLAVVANYTFSKTLLYQATSLINPRNYRSVAPIDFPHIFRLFGTYDLPTGRGRAFGNDWPRWLDNAIGGWSLTWVTKYTSGEPLGITDGSRQRPLPIRNAKLDGPVSSRLGDRIDPVTKLPANPYFDTRAFQRLADDFTITPEPPLYGWLRGPSAWQHNITLFKIFSIFEKAKFELRGEINNPFNSPIFSSPGTNLSSPTTFGVINSAGGSRTITVGGKLRF